MNTSIETKKKASRISEFYWLNGIFLILTPLVSLIGIPLHLSIVGFSWANLILFAFFFCGNRAIDHRGISQTLLT
ncbi:MAG: hypothetical protein HYR79_01040 [Nitrospirae bacterium]|nr:hypothetical protein [Nitrospirota bacterium]